MDTYIVRQPIVNRRHQTEAYEVLYQSDSSVMYNQRDSRVAKAVIAFFTQVDASAFLEDKDAYLSFTPNLLLHNVPELFDDKKLIIQFDESVLICEEPRALLRRYKDLGFRLALSSFDFNRRYLDILPLIDIMKVDFSSPCDAHIKTTVELAQKHGMRTCAYHVDTAEAMQIAEELGVELFQGEFVSQVSRAKVHITDHLRTNFFRLMAAIYRDEPNFDEIAEIISMDVTLTFSLLRIVNSAYFALPNRVSSVHQALTILGLKQLSHWIYLLSFSGEDSAPSELIRSSFLRGTFCQNIAGLVKNLPVAASEAYMMGIFSTLDALLGLSMQDAVHDLPISEEIKTALCGGDGLCRDLLLLAISYEKGEWSKATALTAPLGLSAEQLGACYIASVETVNKTWDALLQASAQ